MTRKQLAYLVAARNVLGVLAQFAALFAGISYLVALRKRIQDKVDLIETITQEQERSQKGITADKNRIRDLVIDTVLVVCGQIGAWARETSQLDLAEQATTVRSRWIRVPQGKLAERMKAILGLAKEHREPLAAFGLSDELLAQLETRIQVYDAIVVAPRSAITRRKTLTGILDEELRGLADLFDNVLDPLMLQFKDSEVSFFQGYRNARSVVKPASTPIETILERKIVKATSEKARKDAKTNKLAAKAAGQAAAEEDRRSRREELKRQAKGLGMVRQFAVTEAPASRDQATVAEASTDGLSG